MIFDFSLVVNQHQIKSRSRDINREFRRAASLQQKGIGRQAITTFDITRGRISLDIGRQAHLDPCRDWYTL
jgi:hypothetical protein